MPASLLDRVAALTDPRGRHGRRYGFVPLLGLCLVGILAGHTTLAAIAQFGRLRGHRLGHALGFTRGSMPCPNTLSNPPRELDPDHLDRVIGEWLADRHPGGWGHLALDGKVVRGSRDGDVPGTHLLAADAPQAAAVVAQMRVEATTNEHKAALRLLGVLPPLGGAVVPADATFTHADVSHAVRGKGGDDILYAKGNQLGRDRADAVRLLGLVRSHWGIENGLHHVRGVTLREDRCRVRRGHAPRVLASLRNVTVHLLRGTDHPSAASATRAMAARPDLALAMLYDPGSISA